MPARPTHVLRGLTAAVFLTSAVALLPAQAPPAPPAAGGLVTGSRSYSPMVADVDKSTAFFRDVIGMTVPPPPQPGPYPWAHEPWHRDLHGLQGSPMRFTTLTMPAALVPGYRMLVEPVQQGAVDMTPLNPRPQDPGAFTFIVVVRDLNAMLTRVKSAETPVVTAGGAPIAVPAYGGASRAIVVKDPDGHFVELVQLDPAPQSTAAPDQNVLGGKLRIAVDSLDRTLVLYRDLFGLSFDPAVTTKDARVNELVGLRGASARIASTRFPQSNQHLEFVEFGGVDRRPLRGRIQDPGSVRLQVNVRSLEQAIDALRKAGPSTIVSSTGRVLQDGSWEKGIIVRSPQRWLTVTDLNNVFLILGDRDPAAPPPAGRGGRGGQ